MRWKAWISVTQQLPTLRMARPSPAAPSPSLSSAVLPFGACALWTFGLARVLWPVAREFVISGASTVIGIDAAESITREARKLDETAGGYVEYLNTIAEATGLP